MAFAITPEHIARHKKIGHVQGAPLFEVVTTGGLYINILKKDGKDEIVGTGSHRAISRYITKKKLGMEKVVIDELSKSEDDFLPDSYIERYVPKYEELTNRFRELQGIE